MRAHTEKPRALKAGNCARAPSASVKPARRGRGVPGCVRNTSATRRAIARPIEPRAGPRRGRAPDRPRATENAHASATTSISAPPGAPNKPSIASATARSAAARRVAGVPLRPPTPQSQTAARFCLRRIARSDRRYRRGAPWRAWPEADHPVCSTPPPAVGGTTPPPAAQSPPAPHRARWWRPCCTPPRSRQAPIARPKPPARPARARANRRQTSARKAARNCQPRNRVQAPAPKRPAHEHRKPADTRSNTRTRVICCE